MTWSSAFRSGTAAGLGSNLRVSSLAMISCPSTRLSSRSDIS